MYEKINTMKAADDWGFSRLAAARMRARYLFDRIDEWLEDGSDLALYWVEQAFAELDELVRKAWWKPPEFDDDFTQDQIQQAREYPIDQLIDFRKGRAYAWCHDDRNPSLTHNRKHNRAHCFACAKSFNPIDVLMNRDGRRFDEAVKELL